MQAIESISTPPDWPEDTDGEPLTVAEIMELDQRGLRRGLSFALPVSTLFWALIWLAIAQVV
jgi:hypothetical protein